MRQFNGIPAKHFELFLKECEWRFNNSEPKVQLEQLKQWGKKHIYSLPKQPKAIPYITSYYKKYCQI